MTETRGAAPAVAVPEPAFAASGEAFAAPKCALVALGDPFAALGDVLVDEVSFDATLQRAMELGRRIAGTELAGATTVVRGRPQPGAAAGACAREIEELQCSLREGPSVDAVRARRACRFEGTQPDARWPRFASCAAERSIASALSLPITARGGVLGALTFYSYRPQAFGDGPTEQLAGFVRRAAVVIANSKLYWDARTLSENLDKAMRSRSTIDYATGILMANGRRTAEEAFHILVRASQRENRKLREIASDIVERAAQRRPPLPER